MGEQRARSIETRIHDQYAELPDSERKLADVILGSPGDLSAYTATELTSLAGVSKAAGTRLFHRLGFANYDEARLLARDTRSWGSPLYMERKSGLQNLGISGYLDAEIRVLKNSFANLNLRDLDQALGRITAARRMFMTGSRNSHFRAG